MLLLFFSYTNSAKLRLERKNHIILPFIKPNPENLRLGSKKKAEILWMKKDLS